MEDIVAEGSATNLLSDSPSWLTSLAVHLVIILVLALWSLPQLPEITTALLASPTEDFEDFEDIPEMQLDKLDLEEPVDFEIQPETETLSEDVSFSSFQDAAAAPSFTQLSDVALTSALPTDPTDLQGFDGTGTTGRGKMARTAMSRKFGGSMASEEAVENALNWLVEHQNPDGTWSLVHNRHKCDGRCGNPSSLAEKPEGYVNTLKSGTGLALLPFLGAGQTHKQGRYRRAVDKGLKALVAMGEAEKDRPGASWADSGNMYAHGIAAIALTEAYGMTRDSKLRVPAQAAVDYIVGAQDPRGGGWRYRYQQVGDTSVTGWQIMALKSAYLAGLSVPKPTIAKASGYMDLVQEQSGARYVYVAENNGGRPRPKRSIDAVGLLCRMYLGWTKSQPALEEGVSLLCKAGPSENDYYYNYYAAQVIFQHTGGAGLKWREWNRELRDQLIAQQSQEGHEKGSWYVKGPHSERGGRLYMTSLATMSLEVYYRYMPIYQSDAVDREF